MKIKIFVRLIRQGVFEHHTYVKQMMKMTPKADPSPDKKTSNPQPKYAEFLGSVPSVTL